MLIKHLNHLFLGDKSQVALALSQVLALCQVYKLLYAAWESYSRANMDEEGPFKDSCILCYVDFPVFSDKGFLTAFYFNYSLDEEGTDQVHHRLVYCQEPFINPFLMSIFDEIYFHHNDVKPTEFLIVYERILSKRLAPTCHLCTSCGSVTVGSKDIEHLTSEDLECLQGASTELMEFCDHCHLLPEQYDDDPIRDSLLQRVLDDDGCPEGDDGWDER